MYTKTSNDHSFISPLFEYMFSVNVNLFNLGDTSYSSMQLLKL